MDLNTVAAGLGWLLLGLYAALTLTELPRYFKTALGAETAWGPGPAPAVSRRRLWAEVLAAFAVSRLLVALVCAAAYWADTKGLEGFFGAFRDKLFPWDAQHYIDIIDNGYVATGDARLFIVFFPFYPLVCRCVTFMTGWSAAPVALAVSNGALLGCGAAMYRLGEGDGGAALGRRAMLLTMFNPMTYFYSITYSESTFLLVTLLAVLCARRRRFVLAVLFGAMASATRLLGMAIAIPVYWELLRAKREARPASEEPVGRGELLRWIGLSALQVLPVSLGFLGYLSINRQLFGNPTQFMVFQSEHWYQNFGDLGNTLRYCLYNSINYDDHLYQLGVWRPQVLLLAGVPLLLWWRRRRTRPGDAAYTLVYHYVAFAPTWLLSGPRYASCNYALYPMLAGIPRRRREFAALLALELAALAFMTWVGLWRVKVY